MSLVHRHAVLLAFLVLLPASAGCLQGATNPLHQAPSSVWTNALTEDVKVSTTGSLLGGNVPGSATSRIFHVAPSADALRLTLQVGFSAPGNITVRLGSPGGTAYERSFSSANQDDFMRFSPSPGTWNLTVQGVGEGHVNASVDLHGPTS